MINSLNVLRAENNMTQEQVAEKLKVTRQTIISIENGKYTPSLQLAFKIAHLFNKKIEEIFNNG